MRMQLDKVYAVSRRYVPSIPEKSDHMLTVTTERLAGNVYVRCEEFEIFSGLPDDTALVSSNFAVWFALPIAMRLGRNIHIAGTVSPTAARNAERLSHLWETWKPELFTSISVTADTMAETPPSRTEKRLMAFSGGLDSTVALHDFHARTGLRPDLITVHGMDYKRDDQIRFEKLLKKTDAFRSGVSDSQIISRSNASSVMRRFEIKPDIGFGFQLAGTLFLHENFYSRAMIAADFADFYECLIGPYGTTSAAVALFKSENFGIDLLSLERTKAEKAAVALQDERILRSISFCKNYDTRPDNCGMCSKCVRTKALFYAISGDIPDIFLKRAFDPSDLQGIDLSRSYERVFAQDNLRIARLNGRADEFAFLKEGLAEKTKPSRLRIALYKFGVFLRGRSLT